MLARMRTKNMDREKLAMEAGCSETLIGIVIGGGVTHPTFADRIADLLDCTPAQRDGMVNKIHHGTWVPGATLRRKKRRAKQELPPPQPRPCNQERCRETVVIGPEGREIRRYTSAVETAMAVGCSETYVRNRLCHRLSPGVNEFRPYGYTFRLAEEWDALGTQARQEQMRAARGRDAADG